MTQENLPHHPILTSIQPLRWGDMDALGHVNNTLYFRYMEQTRVEWLEKIGFFLTAELTEGFVIINAHCTFLKQMTYPGKVETRMAFGNIGKSSIMSYYEIRKEGDDTLYAEGSSKIVWANYALGKSAPIPEHIRNTLPTH